jgi:hypothetical protein
VHLQWVIGMFKLGDGLILITWAIGIEFLVICFSLKCAMCLLSYINTTPIPIPKASHSTSKPMHSLPLSMTLSRTKSLAYLKHVMGPFWCLWADPHHLGCCVVRNYTLILRNVLLHGENCVSALNCNYTRYQDG